MFNQKYYGNLAKITRQLNKENQRYFGTIQQYLLLAVMTKKESALQEQVINMAQDALEAQNNGESAESYFGKNPRELADEILAQTPKAEFKDLWHLMAGTTGFVSFYLVISMSFSTETMVMPLGNLILLALVTVGFFYVTFRSMQLVAFSPNAIKIFLALMVPIIFFVGLMLVVFLVLPPLLAIPLSYPFDIVILGLIMLFAVAVVVLGTDKTSIGLLAMLLVFGVLAMYNRYQVAHQLEMNDRDTLIALAVMVIAFIADLVWQGWTTYREVKKARQEK